MKRNKNNQRRLCIIIVFSISILFSLLTVQNYAANQTNQTNKNNNVTTSSNTYNKQKNKNTTNTTTTETSSNSANLSDLGILPHDFTGFKPDTTTYEVTVPENTQTIEIYAKAQSTNATVSGTGKKNLVKGSNKLEVVVTAQNGTRKTYTINIIRGEGGNTDENSDGLAELKIHNLNLSPEFRTNVYEYAVKYIGEDTKLNIETETTDESYIVEVTGNEDLKEGENIITILVSQSNGDNVATYQVAIDKSLIDEEAIEREKAKREQNQKIIIIAIIVIIVLVILFAIIKYKLKRNRVKEFSREYFYGSQEELEEEVSNQEITKENEKENDNDNINKKGKRFK